MLPDRVSNPGPLTYESGALSIALRGPAVTKEQKHARVRIAKQLLKQFPKYNNRSFANIITGDEMWVHFYEPKQKIQNTIWATKGGKRPCIAKRTMSIKKVMYVIFFKNQGLLFRLPYQRVNL